MATFRNSDALAAAELIPSIETWLPKWPYAAVTRAELESAYAAASELDKSSISKMIRGHVFAFLTDDIMKSGIAGVYLTAGQTVEGLLAEARKSLANGDLYWHVEGTSELGQNIVRTAATYWSNAKGACDLVYMLKSVVEALIPSQ